MTDQMIFTKPLEDVTVYDLIDDFGSYVADVEGNLSIDQETWDAYGKNPRPFLRDILMDFGNFHDLTTLVWKDPCYVFAIQILCYVAVKNYGA